MLDLTKLRSTFGSEDLSESRPGFFQSLNKAFTVTIGRS